jgi:hypothetical protein
MRVLCAIDPTVEWMRLRCRELFLPENVTAFQATFGRQLRAHAHIINDHFAQEL